MYYYIVDAQKLSQRQYERVQHELYSSLSNYKVAGEVVRITGIRPLTQLIETALTQGASTIVAVGTDDTMHELINATAGREIVLGFIPTIEGQGLGNALGIKNIDSGAKIIAARRIANLDLAKINDVFFITQLSFGLLKQSTGFLGSFKSLFEMPGYEISFSADGKFVAQTTAVGGTIINCRGNNGSGIGNPADGVLDILLLPKLSKLQIAKYRGAILSGFYEKVPGASLIHANKITISTPPGLPLKIGERVLAKTPATVELAPKALKIIVSRDRTF